MGLGALISDKINQWTLLVGMLPLALSIGAGSVAVLPLDARQAEEFFLTSGQSLFAPGAPPSDATSASAQPWC